MGNMDLLCWILGRKMRKLSSGDKKYIQWLQRKFGITKGKKEISSIR